MKEKLTYRKGNSKDIAQLMQLAMESWIGYQKELTPQHWQQLEQTLTNPDNFIQLLAQSECFICEIADRKIVGMAYLVPQGNPTDIYQSDWSYIRFVSVHPDFGGRGIGRYLTQQCIDTARKNGEKIIALHTSEMMEKAISLYEKLGFTILKEIEPRLGKRYWLYLLTL